MADRLTNPRIPKSPVRVTGPAESNVELLRSQQKRKCSRCRLCSEPRFVGEICCDQVVA
jgi:hypothetical protein